VLVLMGVIFWLLSSVYFFFKSRRKWVLVSITRRDVGVSEGNLYVVLQS
jgi:hypothetical protein